MNRRTRRFQRDARRGVLLLVILGLLAMFALVAVAFVVITSQAQRAAKQTQRVDEQYDPPEETLHQAALQLFRGSTSPGSALGPHSLLEDMYGKSVEGTMAASLPVTRPNDATATALNSDPVWEVNITDILGGVPSEFDTAYQCVGSVLTMTSGDAAGESTRIVGYNPATSRVQIVPLKSGIIPAAGDEYVVNAMPFSGLGFGYNAGTGDMDKVDPATGKNLAFLPGADDNLDPDGGANEDYDAVDFQNMALAAQIKYPDPTDPTISRLATIPSFHRPSLIQYHAGGGAWTSMSLDLLRKSMLRPIGAEYGASADHPDFTGSNPDFDPTWDGVYDDSDGDGQCDHAWDVDNDGDGVADGIWLDLGLPVRSTADGRLYKPLVSFLCVDLDGRLNLNAHGCWDQATAAYDGDANASTESLPSYPGGSIFATMFAGSTATAGLSRGLGYGPAEINLRPLFDDSGAPYDLYQQLLGGNTTVSLTGRNGYGASIANAPPGMFVGSEPASVNQHSDLPGDYSTDTTFNSYGSPPDFSGRMAVGLDLRGQPIYTALSANWETNADYPYESNLNNNKIRGENIAADLTGPYYRDGLFSPNELERILRPYDCDATTLPSRLAKLTATTGVANESELIAKRHAVTTESFDVPVPPTALPASYTDIERTRLPNEQALHITDLLRAKDVPEVAWKYLLPPDLLAGRKMNINTPLGDGVDNDGNGVVDEPGQTVESGGVHDLDTSNPGETLLDETSYYAADGSGPSTTAFNHVNGLFTDGSGNVGVDVDNDGDVDDADEAMARQLQARYLFVLAMLFADEDFKEVPGTPAEKPILSDPAEKRELWIRRLAQWAINVVDFRDSDAIMTPFEYDSNPWDGWNVDGDISTTTGETDRGVVWGSEGQDVILTETLAFHDRRVADTAWDPTLKKRTDSDGGATPRPADDDLDQTRVPQGSAFFELYCPRNRANVKAPPELYEYSGGAKSWYVDLARLAPDDGSGLTYPVWRMVVTESHILTNRPESNVQNILYNDSHDPYRPNTMSFDTEQISTALPTNTGTSSLLMNPTGLGAQDIQIERIIWFAALNPTGYADEDIIYYRRAGTAALLPGCYAVVGPRQETYVGSKNTGLGNLADQKIVLNPSVSVQDMDASIASYPGASKIKTPVGLIVAANPPATWTNASTTLPNGVGISISEPVPNHYYTPEPTPASGKPVEWYGDPDELDSTKGYFRDEPFEHDGGNSNYPINDDQLWARGTTTNYKTVILQRLANPLQPYDAVTNPYLSVDWLPIDLTVFNGEDTKASWPPGWAAGDTTFLTAEPNWDPDDPYTGDVKFASRQRGGNATDSTYNILRPYSEEPDVSTALGGANEIFNYELTGHHSLGFLNVAFQDPTFAANPTGTAPGLTTPAEHLGDPLEPFPWLTWNNRPYVSQLELMMVPSSHPGRLLWEFTMDAGATENQYKPTAPDNVSFSHLLNFFYSSTDEIGADPSPQLARVLDYLYVPSRFAGTAEQASPSAMAAANVPGYMPPNHWIPTYREPGRMNINTIFTQDAFYGLMAPYYSSVNDEFQDFWNRFVFSRRHYGSAPSLTASEFTKNEGLVAEAIFDTANSYPSRFARPFRSTAGGQMVPDIGGTDLLRPSPEINATLLREDPVAANEPLFRFESTDEYQNSDRSAFFRYQKLQRLGNLVTTRSNVYAVWMTVGYFEVSPVPTPDVTRWPDGYELQQELGSDTGDIKRHRAFYIFDRSIPVGFQRGKDLNVDDAILLHRMIE